MKPCSLKIWFLTSHNCNLSSYSDADGSVCLPGYDAMYMWYVDTGGLNVRDSDHSFSLIAIRFFFSPTFRDWFRRIGIIPRDSLRY